MKTIVCTLGLILALSTTTLAASPLILGGGRAKPHALVDQKTHTTLGTYADYAECREAYQALIPAQDPELRQFRRWLTRYHCEPTR